MNRKEDIYQNPFNEAGHLTPGALEFFSGHKVTAEVQTHLDHCELCRDALEGFRQAPPGDSHAEVLKDLRRKLERRRYSGRRRLPVRQRNWEVPNWPYYLAVAASVLVLIGYFTFLPESGEKASPVIAEQVPSGEQVRPPEPQEITIPKLEKETFREAPAPQSKTETPGLPEKKEITLPAAEKTIAETEDITISESALSAEYEETEAASADTIVDEFASPAGTKTLKTAGEKPLAVPAGRAAKKVSLDAALREEDSFLPEGKFRVEIGGKEYLLSLEHNEYTGVNSDTLLPMFVAEGYRDFADYLSRNLVFPEDADPGDLPVTVVVSFGIDRKGRINGPECLGHSFPEFEREALRLIARMPGWVPGKIHGSPIPSRVEVPVIFWGDTGK